MEKTMKNSYRISRIILTIITVIIFNILFINEDEAFRIIISFIFAIIVFGLSYPSSVISRKFINVGDNIEKNILKILYYILALPLISILVFGGICLIMYCVYESIPTPNEMGAALGQALMFLLLVAIVFIGILLPYIQTIIVLILKRFL